MVSSFDVVRKIQSYLEREVDLDSFRQWIFRAHVEVANQKDVDRDVVRLIAEVEGRYAQLDDGMLPDQMWKNRLRALIAPRPQSAEALLLNYFYSTPSGIQSSPMNFSFDAPQTSNFNGASNYQPLPDEVAA
jgi:hypothetical protein